jgi:glycosyltransferase involved in cell wall biosynthesis
MGTRSPKPHAVFVGKNRINDPIPATFRGKFDVHARYVDQSYVVTGPPGVEKIDGITLVRLPGLRPRFLGGVLFYAIAPPIALALSLRRRPSAVVCQSVFEGLGIVVLSRLIPRRWRPRTQIEIHGDWKTAPRLYGSRNRRVVAPLTDRLAPWVLRQADQVRTVGTTTTALAREAGFTGPIDCYCAYSEYSAFSDPPIAALPAEPKVLFVGVLERYKAVEVLLDAWARVVAEVPGVHLDLVGTGTRKRDLLSQAERLGLGDSVTFIDQLPQPELSRLMDSSYCLVLPSRSEGLPRITLETMARARPMVAAAAGGIPELVVHERTGLLVEPDDAAGLAREIVRLLNDRDLAHDLGVEAHRQFWQRHPAEECADGLARLADWIAESA